MHVRGSASWRFEMGSSDLLHHALFIRDAAALPLQHEDDIPPPLTGLRAVRAVTMPTMPTVDSMAASAQWATWWRRLTNSEADESEQARHWNGEDPQSHADEALERSEELFDPPGFASLAVMPELRSLARRIHQDAIDWFSQVQAAEMAQSGDSALFPWEFVRAAAEHVAADRGVPLGAISGVVQLLHVGEVWSYTIRPGYALCSVTLPASPARAWTLLEEVFASALG